MPRKGENIYKRKDGRWEGRFLKSRSPQGKACYQSVYGKTYSSVKEKLRMAAAAREKEDSGAREPGADGPNQPSAKPAHGYSFSLLAAELLTDICPNVKTSTYIKYRNLLHSYLLPAYLGRAVDSITEDEIRALCQRLLAEGGAQQAGLSCKTVADMLSVFRSILHYASAREIETSCTGKEFSVRREPGELAILQRDEQERLCRYLTERPTDRNLGIFLCLFTGLRIGELCALKWSDISFARKTIHVHQTMQRIQVAGDGEGNSSEDGAGSRADGGAKDETGNTAGRTAVIITTPKSACSIRTIPLPANVQRFMEQNFAGRTGYLLTGTAAQYVEPRVLQRYFKRVLKEAKIDPINFHALRHTFATRCVEVGFDAKSLSEILGHSSVSITMNRYVHPTMEMKTENMQKLSALFAVR